MTLREWRELPAEIKWKGKDRMPQPDHPRDLIIPHKLQYGEGFLSDGARRAKKKPQDQDELSWSAKDWHRWLTGYRQ